jgi:hypothetical protein
MSSARSPRPGAGEISPLALRSGEVSVPPLS